MRAEWRRDREAPPPGPGLEAESSNIWYMCTVGALITINASLLCRSPVRHGQPPRRRGIIRCLHPWEDLRGGGGLHDGLAFAHDIAQNVGTVR